MAWRVRVRFVLNWTYLLTLVSYSRGMRCTTT
jgi:hypothetical protein